MLAQSIFDEVGESIGNGSFRFTQADRTFSTTCYDAFSFNPRNRPIRQAKLKELTEAIRAKNLLRDNPILVDRDLKIIDGQHRLLAARNLGVPLFYKFSHEMTIDDVPETQRLTSQWDLKDRLHTWCAAGNVDYLALRQFMEDHPFLSPNFCVRLCQVSLGDGEKSDALSPAARAKFHNGGYRANDLPFARRVAAAILDFKEYAPKVYRQRAFGIAILNLMSNADYDHNRMIQKISYQRARLHGCTSAEQYIDLLNEIYNYKTTGAHRVELRMIGWNNAKYRADLKG